MQESPNREHGRSKTAQKNNQTMTFVASLQAKAFHCVFVQQLSTIFVKHWPKEIALSQLRCSKDI